LVALPSTGPDVEEGVGVPGDGDGDGVGVEVGDGDPAGAGDPDAVASRADTVASLMAESLMEV
jgi:hypothetical protein